MGTSSCFQAEVPTYLAIRDWSLIRPTGAAGGGGSFRHAEGGGGAQQVLR